MWFDYYFIINDSLFIISLAYFGKSRDLNGFLGKSRGIGLKRFERRKRKSRLKRSKRKRCC